MRLHAVTTDSRPRVTRVIHVINTLEVGGGAEHLVQLARGLASHGFESSVLAGRDGPGAARLRELGARVDRVSGLDGATFLPLVAALKARRPDLLHLHGSRSGLLGTIAARFARVTPVVYTAHMFAFRRRLPAPLPWLAERAEAMTCAGCDRVICVSRTDRDEAARRGLPGERLVVIPNGIEMHRFPACRDRRPDLGLDAGTPVVGVIGRLVEQKNPIAFVDMARRVAEIVPDARFLVIGDGPLRGEVEGRARRLLGDDRLRVVGFRSDVPEMLATLDVVVFPSLWEAQGIGLIEAMAAKRAVVATRLPAHAEAIEPGTSGLLVPADDPDAMAEGVVALLRDPAERARLGEAARQRVESRYRIEAMIDATAALYRDALAARSASQAA
jgi:glycosyltransferase involved in cell wall biosynthesis